MDLAERYQALVYGATLVAESAEDAYRLGALDRFLKPWIRGRLDSLGALFASCDTSHQLARDTRALATTAASYSELREQLFSDLHHTRPEPPWRTVARGEIAIRAQSVVLLRQPTFVLRRLDAGLNVPGAATWEFVVITKPSDPTDEGTSFVVMVSADDQQIGVPIAVSKELESERAWYQQLEYGFYSLGIRPVLTALQDPDRHLKRSTDDGDVL
ncbi:hypothetical protein [Protofrankia symbiont of Coriaria ruscifolia]|uniref:hypothetical protein n=1 Tax=Protofrankia symbiont of Coriaria ruscifolia TaxID=1306542 RepID=UPI0010417C46|nr:hypothetical protein [Protofrankia symbiont of Coriaria ruscifolia]